MGRGEGGSEGLRGPQRWECRGSLRMTEMGEGDSGVLVDPRDGGKKGKEVFGAKEGMQGVPVPWRSPVMVPIAEGTHGNGKGCPNGVQCVPYHLRLVADGETGGRTRGGQGGHSPIPTPLNLSPPQCSEDFWTSPPMSAHGDIRVSCAGAEPSCGVWQGHCVFERGSLTSHLHCCDRRP